MNMRRTGTALAGITAVGVLAGCNIDRLAAEFYFKGSTGETTEASSSGEASSGGSGGSSASSESTGESTSVGESTSAPETGDTSSGSSSGQAPAVCGDGVVEGDEECDDANDDDVDSCSNDCATAFTIFVTSDEMFTGKINGLVGADNRCVNAALKAALPRALHYTALISDSTTDAAERVHHARGWYRLVNTLPVARGWDGLMTGPLVHAVNVNEKSETADTVVWTGTAPGGVAVPGASHCNDWKIESAVITGHFGVSTEVDSNWLYRNSETNPTICYDMAALYCVEQP